MHRSVGWHQLRPIFEVCLGNARLGASPCCSFLFLSLSVTASFALLGEAWLDRIPWRFVLDIVLIGNCIGFRMVFIQKVSGFAFALVVNEMFFSSFSTSRKQ